MLQAKPRLPAVLACRRQLSRTKHTASTSTPDSGQRTSALHHVAVLALVLLRLLRLLRVVLLLGRLLRLVLLQGSLLLGLHLQRCLVLRLLVGVDLLVGVPLLLVLVLALHLAVLGVAVGLAIHHHVPLGQPLQPLHVLHAHHCSDTEKSGWVLHMTVCTVSIGARQLAKLHSSQHKEGHSCVGQWAQ